MSHPDAFAVIEQIAGAGSPEEAAKVGRATQAQHPHLVRPDWDTAKLFVMESALRTKVALFCICCDVSGSRLHDLMQGAARHV